MIFKVHQDATLKKQLKALRKAGGRTALVADHAELLVEKLALTSKWDFRQTGRRTRHGEVRIKNCIKFDLVDGYRLLGISRGQDVIFLYIGSHDECDRWIRNKRGLRSVLQRDRSETVSLKEIMPDTSVEEEESESDATARDEYLTANLDEKLLRKVFRGLTGK